MAQRIRTLKPSFWSSHDVNSMTWEERGFTIGLMSFADDDGRFIASQSAICGYLDPFGNSIPPAKYRRWMADAEQSTMIHTYTVAGLTYGVFPAWHDHQKINRYTPSTLPAPDIECAQRNGIKGEDE